MKEIKNKSIVVGALVIAVVMIVAVLGGCGSNRYVFDENDFRLTIEVDKTEARVGDTVVATARFENLSGRDLRVQAGTPSIQELEGVLNVVIVPDNFLRDPIFDDSGGRIPRRTLRAGAVITRQTEVIISEELYHIAFARVFFSIGRQSDAGRISQEQNRTWVHIVSEEIAITIQGDK